MSLQTDNHKIKMGLVPAICLVVANMVGVGVFTSLGYQTLGIKSIFALLFLWLLGGIIALSGALTYGELTVRLPRSGGEYNFLSRIYHPALGFLSGWISSTVGFAAPMAAAAMAFGEYFTNLFPGLTSLQLSSGLILILTIINIISFKFGSSFQTIFTILNIILIVFITVAGIALSDHSHFHLSFESNDFQNITNPAFAVSLVYVSFAYSGWNSATYVAGEISEPKRNLPRALFWGTLIVTILYMGLNFVFLYSTPVEHLVGKKEVAFIAANYILGSKGAIVIAIVISIGLIACVNSMMIAGPRVTEIIGEDFPFFKIMSKTNKKGSPIFAILFQSSIALILIFTAKFDQVISYIGFTLSLFTTLTVAGVFVLRSRKGLDASNYRTWGYPVTPIIFLCLEIWMMIYLAWEKPYESLAGLLTITSGLIVFFILRQKDSYQNESV